MITACGWSVFLAFVGFLIVFDPSVAPWTLPLIALLDYGCCELARRYCSAVYQATLSRAKERIAGLKDDALRQAEAERLDALTRFSNENWKGS